MRNSKTWAVAILAAAACLILSANTAQAAWGYVSGYLKHYQNQGNFCENDGRSCDGAQYLRAEYQTVVPVRNVTVYLRDQSDVVIGTGTTDTTGYFFFYWASTSMPTTASIFWTMHQRDSRFQVLAPSGATYILWFSGITLVQGSIVSTGTHQWGTSGAPHELTNVYDGAEKMWRQSLGYANRMITNFANVEILALSNGPPYSCASSCAWGDDNRIQLSLDAPYRPQSRVMHEMGHIAIYKSNPHVLRRPTVQFFADYTFSGFSWTLNGAEYRAASFEEGLATFFGDTAIYWHWNPQPHTCLSVTFCPLTYFNVETSTGVPGCSDTEGRWPLSVDRYLRDMYDSVSDPGFGETMTRPYSEFFDVLAQFPAGTGGHQKDETFNAIYTALDAVDGRSACNDFGYQFQALTGLTSVNQCTNNCSP